MEVKWLTILRTQLTDHFKLYVLKIHYLILTHLNQSCSKHIQLKHSVRSHFLIIHHPLHVLPPPSLPLHCLQSYMKIACPVHPSASLEILGLSLPTGLLAPGSAEDVALLRSVILMIIHSETETINPVFSHCIFSLKRITPCSSIGGKLNACQFERVLQLL